jgi:hypothetical protein
MYASPRGYHVPIAHVFRDVAAASGAALVAMWLVMLALETFKSDETIPNVHSYVQALVLVGVFAGYAIGWRHELTGAALVIAGTALFFAVGYAEVGVAPPLPAAWFAIPGVLYLLAWMFGDRRQV